MPDLASLMLPAFFAALFTSIGGLVVWYFQSRAEKLRKLEESLRERQLELYSKALDPYFRVFAGLSDQRAQGRVLSDMKSVDYRRTVFHLSMFGSDDVVRAFNAMMQFTYKLNSSPSDPRELMRLWALVLLAIRRSAGNPDTKLHEWDMLASTIKDIEILERPTTANEGAAT